MTSATYVLPWLLVLCGLWGPKLMEVKASPHKSPNAPHDYYTPIHQFVSPMRPPTLQQSRPFPGTHTRHYPSTSGQPNPLVHHVSSGFYNQIVIYPGAMGNVVDLPIPSKTETGPIMQQPALPMLPFNPIFLILGHMVPQTQGQDAFQGSQPGGAAINQPDGSAINQPDGSAINQPDGSAINQPDGGGISQPDGGGISQPVSSTRVTLRENTCTFNKEIGVCYPQGQCASEGGRVTTYCRDFTKSCCIFNFNCGASSNKEVIHFRNAYWPLPETIDTACGMMIQKMDSTICHLRIRPTKLSLPASTGFCDNIYLHVSGVTGKNYAKLCGELDDKEYDVDVSSTNSVSLKVNTDQSIRVSWNIVVVQIPCTESPGMLWPQEGDPIPADTSSSSDAQETPSDPSVPSGVSLPAPETNIDVCGISYSRSRFNVRDRGVVARRNAGRRNGYFHQDWNNPAQMGERRQIPIRREEEEETAEEETVEVEEEECEEGQPGRCTPTNTNPDSQSQILEWDVPVLKDTILYKYAGPPRSVGTRITYGKKTEPHKYPWNVAMYNSGKFHCGGTLISNRHVLTAAHCVKRYQRRPSRINLSLGDWDINTKTDGPNIVGKVKKIKTHPGYSTITLKYDVAVLTLEEPITITDTMMPICLPSSDLNLDGKLITVTGWGRDERNKLQSVLMEHSASVVSTRECNRRWESTGAPPGIIADSMLCMDPQDGDSCKGDSGGPSILEHPSNSGSYIQVGIVSFGSPSCTDKNLPGVYTHVPTVVDWIKSEMH